MSLDRSADWSRRTATVADHVGRGTLPDGAFCQPVLKQGAVAVGVHVYETRADDAIGCIDHPTGGRLGAVSNRGDACPLDAQVVADTGCPRAVKKCSAPDDQIERGV